MIYINNYKGFIDIILTDNELAKFYETNVIDYNLYINQYILIRDIDNRVIDKRRFDGQELLKIKNIKFKNVDILKPLDDIQLLAYDALFNKDIKVVCLTGKSGTGKTKTALSVGLELLKQGLYDKVILIRHAEESGKSIGFLKGDKNSKMIDGWAGCFYDNLEGTQYEFEDLINKDRIEIESVSLLKGRNFRRSFVIFDEAEDAFPEQIELVGTRINDDCKLVFVSDYEQVSNQKYKTNSGILKLINKAKGKDWFVALELQTNGRGSVATFFGTEFKEG